ncbi:C40 family peptidase [Muricomes intestini]|jgi:cell wall-associated NlpC family hydrolase|uniref:Peptidoglycan hydrolase CwlO-like protein n=1 Tax=Muricomes intestini TaxID=1796634 RepID=A0A4R3K158_9FIRM|nr:C40 family peptidase [Muricomes intestini]TCS74546.1 peptidoglycan hydrolase CwlO-like protein [Muricomes intestini]
MKIKKVRNVLTATALTCSMITVPVFAAPANSSSLESQKKQTQSEVDNLQSQLSTLMSKMTELQSQLISKGQEITEAKQKLADAQEKEKQQYEDMKLRIKYMYEEGDGSALERIISSGSIADMLSQAEYVQKIHSYDRDMLNEYVDTVTEVKNLETSLENDMDKLEEIQTQYEDQQTEMNTTIEGKRAEVANLDQQIQEAAKKAAEEEAARQKAAQETAAKNNSAAQIAGAGGNGATPETQVTPTVDPPVVPDTPAPPANTGNTSAAQAIVNAAWTQIGVPYVYGGSTPYVALDCSGLTQWCHAQAGISIGRTDWQQLAGGQIVYDPQPGDICWTPGHVAIYIGGGQMIEAQQDGVPVCVSSVRATSYVRYW